MDCYLIAARAVHYASTISLDGLFTFLCVVAGPTAAPRLRRQLSSVAWASLALALFSGGAWLLLVSAQMSGQPVAVALAQGVVATVLTGTRFGYVWVWRFGFAAVLVVLLLTPQRWRGRLWSWAGLALAAAVLGTLAWAGHGGATPGRPGELHLAADILHLLAAGAWLGSLIPLALFLAEMRRSGAPERAALVRQAVRRFSLLAAVSVAILFAAGLVNTWFLAGTLPALIGTLYGRLLLAKIAIFATMVTIGAVNLLRMAPRLAPTSGVRSAGGRLPSLWLAAVDHLRRNAVGEAALGLAVLAIVGILGILPPGLHTEPGWPLPFRFELGVLATPSKIVLAILAAFAAASFVIAVATAAAGRYRRMSIAWSGLALWLGLGWIALRPALEPAYPTSFYAPAQPYAAASVERGARLYAANCALCHGADGRGDGPAAAGLAVHPADLTAPHLFAHTPGDLFWWVSRGRAGGVMPGFAAVMNPAERWDVINFVRARAAGMLSRRLGSQVSNLATGPVPDFAFEAAGRQQTLDGMLQRGPVLLALFSEPPSGARLAQLAAIRKQLGTALRVVAVDLGPGPQPNEAEAPLPLAGVSAGVGASLALFRSPDDGGETLLLLDRAGAPRARWTRAGPGSLPDAASLVADAALVARFPAAAASHAGHAH